MQRLALFAMADGAATISSGCGRSWDEVPASGSSCGGRWNFRRQWTADCSDTAGATWFGLVIRSGDKAQCTRLALARALLQADRLKPIVQDRLVGGIFASNSVSIDCIVFDAPVLGG